LAASTFTSFFPIFPFFFFSSSLFVSADKNSGAVFALTSTFFPIASLKNFARAFSSSSSFPSAENGGIGEDDDDAAGERERTLGVAAAAKRRQQSPPLPPSDLNGQT